MGWKVGRAARGVAALRSIYDVEERARCFCRSRSLDAGMRAGRVLSVVFTKRMYSTGHNSKSSRDVKEV